MTSPELLANAFNAASVVLAGRNSLHTWWTGIVGCVLFCWVFYGVRLYADATLQVFFVGTSVVGWVHWRRRRPADDRQLEVRTTPRLRILGFALAGLALASGYAAWLSHFTDAAAPLADACVLAFSVTGQLLLMGRRVETWWFWLVVNTIAVPLFASRGLYLTALLYLGFWINAWLSWRHWRSLAAAS